MFGPNVEREHCEYVIEGKLAFILAKTMDHCKVYYVYDHRMIGVFYLRSVFRIRALRQLFEVHVNGHVSVTNFQ